MSRCAIFRLIGVKLRVKYYFAIISPRARYCNAAVNRRVLLIQRREFDKLNVPLLSPFLGLRL